MSRPHIEPLHYTDVPEEAVAEGPLAGSRRRLLSEDGESHAATALISLPEGWSGNLGALSRPMELFCLSGQLDLHRVPLRPGAYAAVPQRAGQGEALLVAHTAAVLLVMTEEERAGSGGAIEVVGPFDHRFDTPSPAGELPPGLAMKLLHVDAVTNDWTYLASAGPGWYDPRAESHPTVQERFVIRGDSFLGERGALRTGSYFWRPPGTVHGPLATRHGVLFLARSKGGPIAVDYHELPGSVELVEAYFAEEPYFSS